MQPSKKRDRVNALNDVIRDHAGKKFTALDFYNLVLAYFPGKGLFTHSRQVTESLYNCNVARIGRLNKCIVYHCLPFLKDKTD